MARIKYVINERRLAYEGAVKIIAEGKEPEVLAKIAPQDLVLENEEANVTEVPQVEQPPVIPHQTAAERAAAGLLRPDLVRK
jgi:large subunit ribosomal protein L47